jgi:hypothetical protein
MKKGIIPVFIIVVLLIAGGVYVLSLGSSTPREEGKKVEETENMVESGVVFPVAEYASRRIVNAFGEKSQVTLDGYHVADDVEFTDREEDVPVFAIADGIVRRNDWVNGYGGVMVIAHTIEGKIVMAIYGHIDLSSTSVKEGDKVLRGEQIAYLGEGGTEETDGERKHLHFAVYEGEDSRIQGYESSAEALAKWTNPHDFFAQYGFDTGSPARAYNPKEDLGGDEFSLEFLIPEDWEVEYDSLNRILNMFTLGGGGSARERSQILFTYFDTSQFLTLSTVTIHEIIDGMVGKGNYIAKRYDIEKKPGAAAFQGQPTWREERHVAIDFRSREGRTRYFSIAKSPQLDEQTFQRVLESIAIVE